MTDLFSDEDKTYHERDAVLGTILSQSRDLSLKPEELLSTILKPRPSSPSSPTPAEDEPADDDTTSTLPSSPSDVPLSTAGSLYILTSHLASPLLFHHHRTSPITLPSYPNLLTSLLPSPSSPSLGNEPPAYLDALFLLGLWEGGRGALDGLRGVGDQHPTFPTAPLQQLTLLSSRLPSPSQRYQAHTLASRMLHAWPSARERWGYVRDTLEHCPYENVRAEAVGWAKDEVVGAFASPMAGGTAEDEEGAGVAKEGGDNVFGRPELLQELQHLLFPGRSGPSHDHPSTAENDEAAELAAFLALQPFNLAVLNLVFLIFSNRKIMDGLEAKAMQSHIVAWVEQLQGQVKRWEEKRPTQGEEGEEKRPTQGEMGVLGVNCEMVLEKMGTRALED